MTEEWPLMTSDDVLKIMTENTTNSRIKDLEDRLERLERSYNNLLTELQRLLDRKSS